MKRIITTGDIAREYFRKQGLELSNVEALKKLKKQLESKTDNRPLLNEVTKRLCFLGRNVLPVI